MEDAARRELSLHAQGQKVSDPKKEELPKVTGEISRHVELLDGVAHFSKLSSHELPVGVPLEMLAAF